MTGLRLALYRRAAGALNRFCARWAAPYCADCLEVTRHHHRGDPRADVDLVEGVFPGCCQAGVADALWVPGAGGGGRFPESLKQAVLAARAPVEPTAEPRSYLVRERQSGLLARGVACAHFGESGCRLGDLKGPLCLVYLCDPLREAFARVAGEELVGADADDFCGARSVIAAVVLGPIEEARMVVEGLDARLVRLHALLEEANPAVEAEERGCEDG